jgi:hypothetical protein
MTSRNRLGARPGPVSEALAHTPARKGRWAVVVFEGAYKQFEGEAAYVVAPFDSWEQAEDWTHQSEDCRDGEFQIVGLTRPAQLAGNRRE